MLMLFFTFSKPEVIEFLFYEVILVFIRINSIYQQLHLDFERGRGAQLL